jgi:hypothetical protein
MSFENFPLRKSFEQTDTVLSRTVALTARVACKLQPNFDFESLNGVPALKGLNPLLSATVNDFNGLRGYLATGELNIRQLHSKHEPSK